MEIKRVNYEKSKYLKLVSLKVGEYAAHNVFTFVCEKKVSVLGCHLMPSLF